MKRETQALHLAKMMQDHIPYLRYELALPLCRVRSSKLKKLSTNDVLLLDIKVLEFVLIEGDFICAELVVQRVDGNFVIVITHLHKELILLNDHNKYETVKLSLGECHMNGLEVGNKIDISLYDLEKIMLIVDNKKRAEGSLVNVDNELAVKINTLF